MPLLQDLISSAIQCACGSVAPVQLTCSSLCPATADSTLSKPEPQNTAFHTTISRKLVSGTCGRFSSCASRAAHHSSENEFENPVFHEALYCCLHTIDWPFCRSVSSFERHSAPLGGCSIYLALLSTEAAEHEPFDYLPRRHKHAEPQVQCRLPPAISHAPTPGKQAQDCAKHARVRQLDSVRHSQSSPARAVELSISSTHSSWMKSVLCAGCLYCSFEVRTRSTVIVCCHQYGHFGGHQLTRDLSLHCQLVAPEGVAH